MAGLMSAVLLCLIASALGLGALFKASPRLFDALRYAGVAYLVWLGIRAWRAPVGGSVAARPARSDRALYATGLLTGLSNPKLIVFAAALFPQFIVLDRPFWLQLGILIASFVVIESFWYGSMRWAARASRDGWNPPTGSGCSIAAPVSCSSALAGRCWAGAPDPFLAAPGPLRRGMFRHYGLRDRHDRH
jgi:threonine/homoserine/homoserine lactone efflux protein